MAECLIELCSEELPVSMQKTAAQYLETQLKKYLSEKRIHIAQTQIFYGPRRITCLLQNLSLASEDYTEERRGPKIGAPEKAVEGFKKGAGVDHLIEKETEKGLFYFAHIEYKGQKTSDILPDILQDIIHGFEWKKSMRWGEKALRWARPLHHIVCVLQEDGQAVPVTGNIAGIDIGNTTSGHHFLKSDLFEVSSFDDYKQKCQDHYVIYDQNERLNIIQESLADFVKKKNLVYHQDEALEKEVAGLCEYPIPLLGDIDQIFHSLPDELLQTSMREHQKFFSLSQKESQKITHFVTFTNKHTRDDGATILKGNKRVLTARLSDAAYFYENDLKTSFNQMNEKLKSVTYHAQLGSIYDRVQRIQAISENIAVFLKWDHHKVKEAALLCKTDLASQTVYEFPELQGIMGRYFYLHHNPKKQDIAQALSDHYLPIGENSPVPNGPISISIALADKLDQLIGFWLIDQTPTGSRDPFALRRAALGIIRILTDHEISLTLEDLIKWAEQAYRKELTQDQKDHFKQFIFDRLAIYLKSSLDSCFLKAVYQKDLNIHSLVYNAEILKNFLATQTGCMFQEAAGRVINILSSIHIQDNINIDKSLFQHECESILFDTLDKIHLSLSEKPSFAEKITLLSELNHPINAFFENVMVNDQDDNIRQNRVALLLFIKNEIASIIDFSVLS